MYGWYSTKLAPPFDTDKSFIGDDAAEAAGHRGKPVTLHDARKDEQARRRSFLARQAVAVKIVWLHVAIQWRNERWPC